MTRATLPQPLPGERHSMRSFLAQLRERGDVVQIDAPVDPARFEVSACLSALDPGPAIAFSNTGAGGMPIVGNLLGSIERIAFGLGVDRAALGSHIAGAISRPLAPRVADSGPAQEAELEADLAALPIPRFFEHETGPYLTAGCVVAREPASGRCNLSYARVKPLGGDRALIGIAPNHHLALFARAAAERGERLPVAVTLGNHPAVLIAAALYLKPGEDEMEVAGALLGEPVAVLRSRVSGLTVPATAEIVIEGEIDATETIGEGPVSEYHGMYERYGAGCVLRVRTITRRRDAMLQVIEPGYHREHVLIGGVAIAAGLQSRLAASIPSVRSVAVPAGGCGRLAAVVALAADHRNGDPEKAIRAAFGAVNLIKQVTVVDDDIDPWDDAAVQWAIATRMRAERDIVIAHGMRTDRSEPIKCGGTIAKIGFDATRRDADRDDWRRARVPEAALARVGRIVDAVRRGTDRIG